jgi:bifunctional DNase/RNase
MVGNGKTGQGSRATWSFASGIVTGNSRWWFAPSARQAVGSAWLRERTGIRYSGPAMIEMRLFKVITRDDDDHQFVYLKEKDGERIFPIVIGPFEAMEIRRKIKDTPMQRPMTHDLIGRILQSVGWKLERIVINDLRDSTFFAVLHVVQGAERREVDCRPSDAIALALQFKAPIFAEQSVLDAAGSQ